MQWLELLCALICVTAIVTIGETSTTASTNDYCSDLVQKVKLPSSCDFEHGACGYTAPKRGFSWLIRRGKYGYGSSGISYGHDGSGHYAVTNINSFGIHIGTNTTLATPLITDANVCLEFWYIMPSTSSNIQVLLYRSNNLITIWNGRGTPHSNWQKLQLSIHSTQPYKIVFASTRINALSYIGLDDIVISSVTGISIQQSTTIAHGSNALLPGSCDFDHSACHYTGSSHNVYWVRQTGTVGSGRFAIPGDHSTDGKGQYASLHLSEFGDHGDLISPQIKAGESAVLQLWYFLTSGRSKIDVLTMFKHHYTIMWTSDGSNKVIGKWTPVTIKLNSQQQPYKIVFRGYNTGHAGIDAIKITKGNIMTTQLTTTTPTQSVTPLINKLTPISKTTQTHTPTDTSSMSTTHTSTSTTNTPTTPTSTINIPTTPTPTSTTNIPTTPTPTSTTDIPTTPTRTTDIRTSTSTTNIPTTPTPTSTTDIPTTPTSTSTTNIPTTPTPTSTTDIPTSTNATNMSTTSIQNHTPTTVTTTIPTTTTTTNTPKTVTAIPSTTSPATTTTQPITKIIQITSTTNTTPDTTSTSTSTTNIPTTPTTITAPDTTVTSTTSTINTTPDTTATPTSTTKIPTQSTTTTTNIPTTFTTTTTNIPTTSTTNIPTQSTTTTTNIQKTFTTTTTNIPTTSTTNIPTQSTTTTTNIPTTFTTTTTNIPTTSTTNIPTQSTTTTTNIPTTFTTTTTNIPITSTTNIQTTTTSIPTTFTTTTIDIPTTTTTNIPTKSTTITTTNSATNNTPETTTTYTPTIFTTFTTPTATATTKIQATSTLNLIPDTTTITPTTTPYIPASTETTTATSNIPTTTAVHIMYTTITSTTTTSIPTSIPDNTATTTPTFVPSKTTTTEITSPMVQHTTEMISTPRVHLKFFNGSTYQYEIKSSALSNMNGDVIYVKAQTILHNNTEKLRITNCLTKPTKQSSDRNIYYLIKDGCPADPNAGILSQAANETSFYFQVFVYADHPGSIYVHCDAKLCKSDDITLACEPVCNH